MTFRNFIKSYIKEHNQVTLQELDFQREDYNHAYDKHIKFSTMERTLRDIVEHSNRLDEDGKCISMELFGYRIDKLTNSKKQITGYIKTVALPDWVFEKEIDLGPAAKICKATVPLKDLEQAEEAPSLNTLSAPFPGEYPAIPKQYQ